MGKKKNYEQQTASDDSKTHKVLISHCESDKLFAGEIVNLFEEMGIPDELIVCTSAVGHGVPGEERIYDWIKKQFTDCKLRIVFVLSHNYYKSSACLNEMGAAWVVGSASTVFLLPGFDFEDIKGCLDSTKSGISLASDDEELRYRLDELKDKLITEFSLPEPPHSRWVKYRDSFIGTIKNKQTKEIEGKMQIG